MEENILTCSLEQELAQKANELNSQRKQRERELVDITLKRISDGVVSHQTDILTVMSGNGNRQPVCCGALSIPRS